MMACCVLDFVGLRNSKIRSLFGVVVPTPPIEEGVKIVALVANGFSSVEVRVRESFWMALRCLFLTLVHFALDDCDMGSLWMFLCAVRGKVSD